MSVALENSNNERLISANPQNHQRDSVKSTKLHSKEPSLSDLFPKQRNSDRKGSQTILKLAEIASQNRAVISPLII